MGSHQRTRLGVAPLSALDATVEEYVSGAAAAGFEEIGLRAYPVLDTDPTFPELGSQRFTDLKARIADEGLEVLDIEVFSVRSDTVRDNWLPVLEAGGELGGSYLNIVGEHPSLDAFTEIMGELTADATQFGLTPILEPVAYRPLNDFAKAVEIARSVGCKVELDVLHFMRTGATIELIEQNREMFPVFQLCDAPHDVWSIRENLLPHAASDDELGLMVAESRGMRQLAGEGDAPIAQLLEIVGDRAAISVEIPNLSVRGSLDPAAYLALLARSSHTYLESCDALRAQV